ncbi:MAG: PEP-CTERM sorting domain-containing protein [Rhodanobacter sp.]|nr:MAG: PEP-CTERM sorting domain-containing protein [Rhodanobacter sp.]TAM00920.1 MAG: PEP-CTERM sorting domain-containing protein [Rhodanobacter sp.]TAM41044.1 MAG: PEP-CTERM sorting domain-containing protein [Rhodanobacter sp.]TAN25784.1 MAG: PEP-CTERM sorting domain-containing protein [Rhodanobacter sp.]
MDATTGAGQGTAFTIAGTSGLSAIAYDGTNFWVADYSGSNQSYLYSPTGTLLKTISLTNCTGHCDGFEFFNGKLIENRGDTVAPYDIYDTNGNLLTPGFITTTTSSTGIAFDGTDFWTSNIFDGSLSQWNGTTGAFIGNLTLQHPTSGSFVIEDLSVNYSQVIPPTGVPEPSELGMFGLGALLIGLFAGLRRRFD